MCDYSDGLRVPVEDLVAAIKNGKPDTALKRLQDLTNCPTCILAAIRQSKIQDGLFYLSDFDYAKEKNAFWRAVNADTWAVDSTYL